jgi:hypothetical protein
MFRVMRRFVRLRTLLLALPMVVGSAVASWADPPARVGRLTQISGTVSFHTSDEDHWSPAVLNEPVTSGNAFWTEPNSRAEIRVGSTAVRMDGSTEFDVTQLDYSGLQAQLPQGTVALHVPLIHDGESYAIATPRGTVTLLRGGRYHIDAGTDQTPTRVAVLQGRAQLSGPGTDLVLGEGESASLTGSDVVAAVTERAAPTPFDEWDLPRAPVTARYVSPETTGYEDLDAAGQWRQDPNYGPVWYPQAVPSDWAPYRYGHWRWVAPWGWTWIDNAPWGFAPFHYGRWAYIGDSWGWVPGPVIVEQPVYAPALVVFIGGGHWRPDDWFDRDPAIGWFPLAPHEVYVPSYAASINYVRNVNVTNVTNVTNITNQTISNITVTNVKYVNQSHATVVSQAAFAGAQPVAHAAVAAPASTLAQAPIVGTGAPVAPRRGDEPHVAATTVAPGPALSPQGRLIPGQVDIRTAKAPTAVSPQAGTPSNPPQGAAPTAASAVPVPGSAGPTVKPPEPAAHNVSANHAPTAMPAVNGTAAAQANLAPLTPAQRPSSAPGPAIKLPGQPGNQVSANQGPIATSAAHGPAAAQANLAPPTSAQRPSGAPGPAIKPPGQPGNPVSTNHGPNAPPAAHGPGAAQANLAPPTLAQRPSSAPGPAIKPPGQPGNQVSANQGPIATSAAHGPAAAQANLAPPTSAQRPSGAPGPGQPGNPVSTNHGPIATPAANGPAPAQANLAPPTSAQRPSGAPRPAIKPPGRPGNQVSASHGPIATSAANGSAAAQANLAPPTLAQRPSGAPGPVIKPPEQPGNPVSANHGPIAMPAANAAAVPTAHLPAPAQAQRSTGAPGPAIATNTSRMPAIPPRSSLPVFHESSGTPGVAQIGKAQPLQSPPAPPNQSTSLRSPAAQPAALHPVPASPVAVRHEPEPTRNVASSTHPIPPPESHRTMPVQQTVAAPRQSAPIRAPAVPPPMHNAVVRPPAPVVAPPPQVAARPPQPVAVAPSAPPAQDRRPAVQQPRATDQHAKDQRVPPRPGEPGYVRG